MEHQFNTRWYASDEDADHWMSYLHRNLHHLEGEDSRFRDSSWSSSEVEAKIHDEILDLLYHDNLVDASLIKVTVALGSIYLIGSVGSEKEKSRVDELMTRYKNDWKISNLLEAQWT